MLELTGLTLLNLSGCAVRTVSPELSRLGQLRRLDLSFNRVKLLPPTLGRLRRLEALDVQSNRLRHVPAVRSGPPRREGRARAGQSRRFAASSATFNLFPLWRSHRVGGRGRLALDDDGGGGQASCFRQLAPMVSPNQPLRALPPAAAVRGGAARGPESKPARCCEKTMLRNHQCVVLGVRGQFAVLSVRGRRCCAR